MILERLSFSLTSIALPQTLFAQIGATDDYLGFAQKYIHILARAAGRQMQGAATRAMR